jgi:hypothetical protein
VNPLRRIQAARAQRHRRGVALTRCAILGALYAHHRLGDRQIAELTGIPLRIVAPELRAMQDAGQVRRAAGGNPGSYRLPSASERRACSPRPLLAGAR